MAGRPREFDEQDALDAMVNVFWCNGFSGTSMQHLTLATGLSKPSLYAAFGNKDAMYALALTTYTTRQRREAHNTLSREGVPLKQRICAYLLHTTRLAANPDLPGGCFIQASSCELDSAALPGPVREAIETSDRQNRTALLAFLKHEKDLGNLPRGLSPAALANRIEALQSGLALMAKRGVDLPALEQVIKTAFNDLS